MQLIVWAFCLLHLIAASPSLAQTVDGYRLPDRSALDKAINGQTVEKALALPITSAILLKHIDARYIECKRQLARPPNEMGLRILGCTGYFAPTDLAFQKETASAYDLSRELCKAGRGDSCALAAIAINISADGEKFDSPKSLESHRSTLVLLDKACALNSGLGCARLKIIFQTFSGETCCRKGQTKAQVDALNKVRDANIWYLTQRACAAGMMSDCDDVADAYASGEHGLAVDKLRASRMFLINCEKETDLKSSDVLNDPRSCKAIFKQLGVSLSENDDPSSNENAKKLLTVEDAGTIWRELDASCAKDSNFACLVQGIGAMIGGRARLKDKVEAEVIFGRLCARDLLSGCLAAAFTMADNKDDIEKLSSADRKKLEAYIAKSCALGDKDACTYKPKMHEGAQ